MEHPNQGLIADIQGIWADRRAREQAEESASGEERRQRAEAAGHDAMRALTLLDGDLRRGRVRLLDAWARHEHRASEVATNALLSVIEQITLSREVLAEELERLAKREQGAEE